MAAQCFPAKHFRAAAVVSLVMNLAVNPAPAETAIAVVVETIVAVTAALAVVDAIEVARSALAAHLVWTQPRLFFPR